MNDEEGAALPPTGPRARVEGLDRVLTGADVAAARRALAAAASRLAEASVAYADARRADEQRPYRGHGGRGGAGRSRTGEFAADELSLMLRDEPYAVRCLLARSRRLAVSLPSVWEAFRRGDVDAEQVRVIDRVGRRVAEPATLTAIDAQVVEAAQTRSPKQLAAWLLRLVVMLEPHAFAERHRKALAERRVTVVQGPDGMGYVTGEVSAADAAAIDAQLAAAARSLGAADPRTEQQRRSDLFADLLLGRLRFELEDEQLQVDTATGEVLTADRTGSEEETLVARELSDRALVRPTVRPRRLRIGVVVPLSSLLGANDAPAELVDRSGLIPGEALRSMITEAIGDEDRDQVLFTRLLTDDGGRLLDMREMGRFASARLAQAVAIRAGTCRFPTCNVPADRCDLDHHQPVPRGETAGHNLDPLCRRHHRAKTFAWLATLRDDDGVEWTLPDADRYRCVDEPLPTGIAA